MVTPVLTIEPDMLRSSRDTEQWAEALVACVRRAAEAGETVVVSVAPKMLAPSEVARGLNMSRSTVSRRIAAGQIRSVKIGNRHRIPYAEYRRLWEQSMTAMAAASAADIEADLFGAQ